MRKLLNTLYILQEKSYVSVDGENVVVSVCGTEKFRVPFCNLENIVCFTYVGASPALMGKCAEENVPLCFLRPSGRFLARVTGEIKGNVKLRREQYRLFDDENFKLNLTKNVIAAKIHNQRMVLARFARDHRDKADNTFFDAVAALSKRIDDVKCAENADSLRGIEGESARMYYSVFGQMLLNDEFCFSGRTKRPPLDEINALLSFLYTLLGLDVQTALETVGLDPYVGFFHTERAGRASLALDLLEEFRAGIADKTILAAVNLSEINKDDFVRKEGGAVLFTDDGKKKILNVWQKKKNETFMHPVIKEKIPFGLLPYAQAQLLARYLRGDAENYTPFVCS